MSLCNIIAIHLVTLFLEVQPQFYPNFGQTGNENVQGCQSCFSNPYNYDQSYVSNLPSYYQYFYPSQNYPQYTSQGYGSQLQYSSLPQSQFSNQQGPYYPTPCSNQLLYDNQLPCTNPLSINQQLPGSVPLSGSQLGYNSESVPTSQWIPAFGSQLQYSGQPSTSQLLPGLPPSQGALQYNTQLFPGSLPLFGSQLQYGYQPLATNPLQYNLTSYGSQIQNKSLPETTGNVGPSFTGGQYTPYDQVYEGIPYSSNYQSDIPVNDINTEIIDVDPQNAEFFKKYFNLGDLSPTTVIENDTPSVNRYVNRPFYIVKSESKQSNFTSPQGVNKNEVDTKTYTFKRTYTLDPANKENAVVNLNFVNGVQVTDAPAQLEEATEVKEDIEAKAEDPEEEEEEEEAEIETQTDSETKFSWLED